MIKNYIVDTNVFLTNAEALFHFEDNNVIVPIGVIEELDKFKKDITELGRNARQTSRYLDELSEKGDLKEGVLIKSGGKVSVRYNGNLNSLYKEQNVDLHVIHVAQETMKKEPDIPCIIVSRDTNIRIRANALGIKAENYEKDSVKKDDINKGFSDIEVSVKNFEELISNKEIDISKCLDPKDTYPNYYYIIKKSGDKKTILARVNKDKTLLTRLMPFSTRLPISPKNKEQNFLFDAILDNDIKLVAVAGKTGSGKTISSIALANYMTMVEKTYKRMLVSRPVYPMGKDIGFLPGPQPLTAKILTPNGWTTMGELQIGSKVIARDGSWATVTGIFPKGIKKVYKITTTDYGTTECCEDHLWFTRTAEDRKRGYTGSVKTTQEIMRSLQSKICEKKLNSGVPRYGKIRPNHFIPRNDAVCFDSKDKLLIPSYTFGCILGDGYIGNSVSISSIDHDLIDRCKLELEEIGCNLRRVKNSILYTISSNFKNNIPERQVIIKDLSDGTEKVYSGRNQVAEQLNINKNLVNERCRNKSVINGEQYLFGTRERWRNLVKNELYKLGLENKRAWEKFIPNMYKYSSIKDRLSLLQGLMDTDGTVGKRGFCCYFTTSLRLANDLSEIVKSLGGRTHTRTRNKIGKSKVFKGKNITSRRLIYEVTVSLPLCYNPFYIKRKSERVKRNAIHGVGITSIEYVGDKEVQCILIDRPEHLYITDDYIVTHNTLEEKLDPWMTPIYDAFDVINKNKVSGREYVQNNPSIVVEPLSYIRGRSIHDQILILDESQNLSTLELKTIISRAGENTKIILTGDIQQIDNPYVDSLSNGLSTVIAAFRDSKIATSLVLEKCVRSELAEEAADRL